MVQTFQLKKINIVLGVVIVAIVLAVGVYYGLNKPAPQKENTPERNLLTQSGVELLGRLESSISTKNWQDYVDTERGFSFKIPSTWQYTEDDKGRLNQVLFGPKDGEPVVRLVTLEQEKFGLPVIGAEPAHGYVPDFSTVQLLDDNNSCVILLNSRYMVDERLLLDFGLLFDEEAVSERECRELFSALDDMRLVESEYATGKWITRDDIPDVLRADYDIMIGILSTLKINQIR